MKVVLEPESDGAAARAATAAALRIGLSFTPANGSAAASGWWRAGLAEAIERAPTRPEVTRRYEAARSPRSTRGATRA